jgi:hypothetical protein
VESESFGETDGESDSAGWSAGAGSTLSESESDGLSYLTDFDLDDDEKDERATRTTSRSASTSGSSSESGSRGRSRSTSRTVSSSVIPITSHEEFREETGRQFRTLEEEWERCVSVLHQLPKREAVVKVYAEPPVRIRIPDVEPEWPSKDLDRFRQRILEKCSYAQRRDVIEHQIEARKKAMTKWVDDAETGDRPFDVKSFRQ